MPSPLSANAGLALLSALSIFAASPATAAPVQSLPTIVLVHGAFADGSSWSGVIEALQRQGYHVTAVQNPLTSLADDVAATRRALDQQDGPTVLVGHSWGGTVISEAGVHDKVIGLVYVSALAPDAGETTAQLYQGFAPTPEFVIDTRPDGFGFVRPANFKAGFANDVSDADAAFMAASQVPIKMSAFGERLHHAAWKSKPSWAVIATEDKAFDQAMLLHMAKRIGADITTVPGSHALFITQAQTVSEVIDRAARDAATKAKSTSKAKSSAKTG